MVRKSLCWPGLSAGAALLAVACSTASGFTPPAGAPTTSLTSEPATNVPEVTPRLSPPDGRRSWGQRHVSPAQAARTLAQNDGQTRFRLPLVSPERTRAVVLLYHAFDTGADPLSISSRRLEGHLEWLETSDVELVSVKELVEFLEGKRQLPQRVAVITIDDGLRSTFTRAWPILRRHRARFSVGIPTLLVEKPQGFPLMTWDQIREMVDSGLCEVASHGHAHRRLVDLPARLAQEELVWSAQILERETGQRPIAFFYPLGLSDAEAEARVHAAGYRAAFGATGGAVALGSSSRLRIPRTGIFHDDTVGRFSWYFGTEFLERLPANWQPAPRLTLKAARTTR